MSLNFTRRDAVLALAAAWSLPTAVASAQTAIAWTPQALTDAEARTLAAACELIMPTTDTPGAIAAGVPQAIDRAIGAWCTPANAQRLRQGLADLDARARAAGAGAFHALDAAGQAKIADALEGGAGGAYWALLREMTTGAYFTSEIGATKALRYDPIPGAYRGCVPLSEIGRAWAL